MDIRPPNRISRSYIQHLVAEPSAVFPLLCPVRECDWIEGWRPLQVLSLTGYAEQDCVFTTKATPDEAVWVILRHEPAAGFVEMIKVTPKVTVCKLSIQLSGAPEGCTALVTYTHTSLGPEGDVFIDGFTESFYRDFMQDWERRLNHHLATGRALLENDRH